LRDLPAGGAPVTPGARGYFDSFTMKFRAGWNDQELVYGEHLARLAEDCGLQAVALHPRTREQDTVVKPIGRAFAEVKRR